MTIQSLFNAQEQAFIEVQRHPLVQEMIAVEPVILSILKCAAMETAPCDRWYAYQALKGIGIRLVGWYARQDALATSAHYEAFLEAVDALLPQEEEHEGGKQTE